jgi:hypothetical protein
MAALVHVAAGFASKPLSPKVPVWVMIVATELLDLLAVVLTLLGIEHTGYIPWSHGLAMSLAWSVAFGALSAWIFRSHRAGVLIGCLVFSHWIIDFITHPMGAVFGGRPAEPDLPLLFGGSPMVGLGLYNYSIVLAYIIEYGTIALGIGMYVIYTIRQRRARKAERA